MTATQIEPTVADVQTTKILASSLEAGDTFRLIGKYKFRKIAKRFLLDQKDHPEWGEDSLLVVFDDCKQMVLSLNCEVEIIEGSKVSKPVEEALVESTYVHPADRFLYKKLSGPYFAKYYRGNKSDYARFSATDVADIAMRTKTDFWHLIKNLGFGCDVITINQVLAYYKEIRTGYTLDIVATQE